MRGLIYTMEQGVSENKMGVMPIGKLVVSMSLPIIDRKSVV